MFRVEIFVDDRKLAECLRNLVGVAVDHPKVEPVVGAEVRRGKIRQVEPTFMTSDEPSEKGRGERKMPPLPDQVWRLLILGTDKDDVTTSALSRLIIEAGGNPNSTAYVRKILCEQKLLIPVKGQQGVMTINRKEI